MTEPTAPDRDPAEVPAAAGPDQDGSGGAAAELGDTALVAAIRAEIAAAGGRLPFARFMELALYHSEHGYYLAAARRPGRGGDFLTAPETTPIFGLTLARQLAECWERLGRPAPFTVREYGAGVGGLAYDLIAGLSAEAPRALDALRYRLVERNPHRLRQALAAMAEVGLGHLVAAEAPAGDGGLPPVVGVVLANEVADAFPVHRLTVRGGRLRERYVVWRDGDPGVFAEAEGEPSAPGLGAALVADLAAAGVTLADGDALDVSPAAAAWFAEVGRGLGRGYAVVIDYGYAATELYRAHRLGGTVRAYRAHAVTDDPFRHVGRQDLTAHVDFTALERAGHAVGLATAGLTTQAAFLTGLGLGDFLVRMQADPTTTAPDYFAAQAAVFRLIDPGGMGRFGVLVMARDAPTVPPLRGLSVPPLDF